MDPIQQQFQDDYNNVGINTNTTVPFDRSPGLNNAGVKTVVGTSESQTTQDPVSSSGNIQNSQSVGYNIGIGWWIGYDKTIPKFFLGNASGNKLLWDGSSLSITGAISASSIDIPDTTTANSFHTDVNGNSWWGATTFNAAPAKISNAGVATFSGLNTINTFVAGENVTVGKLLCFKNKFAAWGDDASASRNTTAVCSSMTYVYSAAGSANTNFGAATLCFQGSTTLGTYTTYLTLDLTSSPPGLPDWNEIDTVYLRLYIVFASGSTLGSFIISRVTSAWSDGTVTYNTRPTDDGITWSTGKVVVESYGSETNAASSNGLSTGYIDFDITELYRLLSPTAGIYTNYGFKLTSGGAGGSNSCQFGGRTRTGGGTFNQAPFVVSYITKDNPGTGNTIVANDGKVYTASNNNYQRVKQLAGICGETVSSGANVSVYGLSDGFLIPNSILSVSKNQDYYLTDTSGTISILTNNIIDSDRWDLHIGIGGTNGLVIDKEKKPLFIRSIIFSVSGTLSFFPPPNCSRVVGVWTATDSSSLVHNGQIEIIKGFITNVTDKYSYIGNSVSLIMLWNSGTTGTIDVTLNVSGGSGSYTLYFYK